VSLVEVTPGDWVWDVGYSGPTDAPLIATVEAEFGRIRINVQGLTDQTGFTLVRIHPSGIRVGVRGATVDPVTLDGGDGVVYDYEAPIGRDLVYEATTVGGTDPPVLTCTARWDTLDSWLKDPVMPSRNMRIRVEDPGDETFAGVLGVFPIPGRPDPVTVSDVRRTATGTLVFGTDELAEASSLLLITASGNTLLFQSDPEFGVGSLYLQFGDVARARTVQYGREAQRRWNLAYTEVAPPPDTVPFESLVTWADVADAYASWAQVLEYEHSWQDLEDSLNILGGTSDPDPIVSWRGE